MSASPAVKTVTGKLSLASMLLKLCRLFMLLMISAMYYYFTPEDQTLRIVFVLVAMVLFTVNHMLYFRRPGAFWWLISFDTLLVTLFGFVYLGKTALYQILFGVLGTTVLIHSNNRRSIILWLTLVLAAWGAVGWMEYRVLGEIQVMMYLLDLGFFLFTSMVGALIRFYQEAQTKTARLYGELDRSHSLLQEAHEQLGSYARQVELLTATKERNHIAREIHDTVGHTMTSLLVQLQVARKLQQKDPSGSQEALLRCEDLARSALQEVRLSVRTLQEEGGAAVSFLDSLRQLLEEFSQLAEVETELAVEGLPSHVPTTLEPVIYRIVQEALTNAKRHGQASSAKVNLRCTAAEVQVEVVDDGLGTGEFATGFGLMQMRKRVSEQGGTLSFSSEKGRGFAVRVRFPLQEQTWRYGSGRG